MLEYESLPAYQYKDLVQGYLERGEPLEPGEFFYEVVTNDLAGAFQCADWVNINLVREWVAWFYQEAPNESWGSVRHYELWLKKFQVLDTKKFVKKNYKVPADWIEVNHMGAATGDFIGDSTCHFRLLLGWRTKPVDGDFISVDKCPEEYIEYESEAF